MMKRFLAVALLAVPLAITSFPTQAKADPTWISGHWDYNSYRGRYWVPGHWAGGGYNSGVWVSGHWDYNSYRGRYWVPGYWKRY